MKTFKNKKIPVIRGPGVYDMCDFSSPSFECSDISGSKFIACEITHADFERMAVREVQFIDCSLDWVNFNECDLRKTMLVRTDLRWVNFNNCKLLGARVEGLGSRHCVEGWPACLS